MTAWSDENDRLIECKRPLLSDKRYG